MGGRGGLIFFKKSPEALVFEAYFKKKWPNFVQKIHKKNGQSIPFSGGLAIFLNPKKEIRDNYFPSSPRYFPRFSNIAQAKMAASTRPSGTVVKCAEMMPIITGYHN